MIYGVHQGKRKEHIFGNHALHGALPTSGYDSVRDLRHTRLGINQARHHRRCHLKDRRLDTNSITRHMLVEYDMVMLKELLGAVEDDDPS